LRVAFLRENFPNFDELRSLSLISVLKGFRAAGVIFSLSSLFGRFSALLAVKNG